MGKSKLFKLHGRAPTFFGICIAMICVLMALNGCSRSGNRAKEADEKSQVPEKVMFTDLSAKGTNGVTVKFRFIRGMGPVMPKGKLSITFRPWTGTGVGDVIASVEHDVVDADYVKDGMGNPDFVHDFTLVPQTAMPETTAWLQAELSFKSDGMERPLVWEEKFIHQQIKFDPATKSSNGAEPDADGAEENNPERVPDDSEGKREPEPNEPNEGEEVLVVALDEVVSDYKLDPVSAHKRYRGKVIEIEGFVMQTVNTAPPLVLLIAENRQGVAQIELPADADELVDALETLSRNMVSVAMQGKCVGYSDDLLKLKDGALVRPTSTTVKESIESLLAEESVASFKAAQEHLDLMTGAGVLSDDEAKSLSSRIEEVKANLAEAAKEHWVPVVRSHIEAKEFEQAEQAIKDAEAELLDAETAKTLREELSAAITVQQERLAEFLDQVRADIVAADYEAARTAIDDALDRGDLDTSTERALRDEIAFAKTARAHLAEGDVQAAAKYVLKNAKGVHESVRSAVGDEVSEALAAHEKKAKETEEAIRQNIIDNDLEAAAAALQKAAEEGSLSEDVVKALSKDGAAARAVREKLDQDDILGARDILNRVEDLSGSVEQALEGEIDTKLEALKEVTEESATQKIKLKDGTEVTLDFTNIADTTKIDSVEVTSEDTTGFVQNVYVKVKFTHFGIQPDAFNPRIKHAAMSRDVHLSDKGEASLIIEKAKIEEKRVEFELVK